MKLDDDTYMPRALTKCQRAAMAHQYEMEEGVCMCQGTARNAGARFAIAALLRANVLTPEATSVICDWILTDDPLTLKGVPVYPVPQ